MMQYEGATFEADGIKKIHGAVEKGPNALVVVFESSFKGKDYYNFREFYHDKNSGNWKPTAKGFTLTAEEDVQLHDLKRAIDELWINPETKIDKDGVQFEVVEPTLDGYKNMKLMFMQERDFVREKIRRIELWQDTSIEPGDTTSVRDLVEDAFDVLVSTLRTSEKKFTTSIDEIATYLKAAAEQ